MLAFHGGVTLACYLAMRLMTVFQSWFPPKSKSTSNIRQEFRLSMMTSTRGFGFSINFGHLCSTTP
ncbi:hypothetical protein BDN70DRAFT_874292 [Pholiota conissans]|uniref:Secreted protein n=1 Tax=Pholiota conissans TaxID=109636 RepID=A0A9P5Z8K3_9AGAR|nr:hypothetical protein BDN70DRAFT_874292 [Pholiota conissans]